MKWILLPLLLWMIYMDFRYRRVWLWQLIVFGIIQFAISLTGNGLIHTSYYTLMNSAVLIVIGTAAALYATVRFRLKKPMIGSGDIIFIWLLTPSFTYPTFVYFILISFVCALAGWAVTRIIRKDASATIPLISYMGICYMIVLMMNNYLKP